MTKKIIYRVFWKDSSITIWAPNKHGMCRHEWILDGLLLSKSPVHKSFILDKLKDDSFNIASGALTCGLYIARDIKEILK